MILLLDIGNTHTHLGLADARRVVRQEDIPSAGWRDGSASGRVWHFVRQRPIEGLSFCSVVPRANAAVRTLAKKLFDVTPFQLTHETVFGVGVKYPHPHTIGQDRLANAVAARHRFGAPVVVVDFGTAVTFDVVDRRGDYIGGIIAPGLAAMTDYLHEKTALLPRIHIREERAVVGKNTEQAMLIGAVHGYRGLVRELIGELKRELKCPRLPVIATGGYAKLMAARIPEINAVDPALTLDGLRLAWNSRQK